MSTNELRHIFLDALPTTSIYTTTRGARGKTRLPERNTIEHAGLLRRRLDRAWREASEQRETQRLAVSLPGKNGVHLEFQSEPGFDLAVKSLEDRGSGIRLMAVRTERSATKETTFATVYVPKGKENHFLRKLDQYVEEKTAKGVPKNRPLVDSVSDIHVAVLKSFWTDNLAEFPVKDEAGWFEIWVHGEEEPVEQQFRTLTAKLNITVRPAKLVFPERLVFVVSATPKQLGQLIALSDHVAEIRRAKETACFFIQLPNAEQVEWAKDLLDRVKTDPDADVAVCILDTGVNGGHMLLAPVLSPGNCQSVDPTWGNHDHHGHGTLMAGIIAYGDLQEALQHSASVSLDHRLESVKILPPTGTNDPDVYGAITAQGISLAEIEAPERQRIVCMAVTTTDSRDRGQPSSWSAELDALSSGCADGKRRLLVVCAGNAEDSAEWKSYPANNLTDEIHDPGQSWNALTIGAYTAKTQITEPDCEGYEPLAPAGGLSPFSTTSLTWEGKWPAKPDIVTEGGNAARDGSGFCSEFDDLSLLSTSHQIPRRQFAPFNMTSAAAAHAAWMAAKIQTAYPEAWPETLRALMVHSAEWTDAMKTQFMEGETKSDYSRLLQVCGYGVPNLARALRCTTNSLTLIAQEELQPFDRKPSGGYRTRDMHLHALPWPRDVLLDLGELPVTMRVTLSYFVEPGPGRIGWRDRYRYASHALRFDVNAPAESESEFLVRLNKAAREDDEKPTTGSRSDRWTIGSNGRNRGSIHSDLWQGTGAELATCNLIGIYPVIGWWRERYHLGRWDSKARYSLVASIHTEDQSVDIYTPVAIQVGLAVPIEISV